MRKHDTKDPMEERKPDSGENPSGVDMILHQVKKRDASMKKVPLRIGPRTIIYVTPDKCNEAYAREAAKRYDSL